MNILLLEDDTALNKVIKKSLELDSHMVTTFYDGADVLDHANDEYDLFIFDINVPNVSGLELLELIYNQNNNAKVIIITSNTDIDTLSKAYKLGCIDYIKKPFHLEELRIKVDKLNIFKDEFSNIKLKDNTTLTKKEKLFLKLLLEHKGRTVTYKMIEKNVYGDKTMTMDGLRALIRRLRIKMIDDCIENVLEEGYKIND